MPFVSIALKQDRSPADRRRIADAVHRALVEALHSPPDDRFQLIRSYGDDLIYDPGYLGIPRTDGIVVVQLLLFPGKPVALKQAVMAAVADRVHADAGVRREDVMVIILEVARENWSFGKGIAQHAGIAPQT